jgi:colanic acid biosynthesis glycosyl transferase WcaI
MTSLAFALADLGWEVHVLTSRQLYGDEKAKVVPINSNRNINTHRLWTTRLGRERLAGRAVDYLTFYASSFLWLMRWASRGDVIVTSTDPPLLSVISGLAAGIRGCRQINWLQDVFPEVARALDVVSPGLTYRMLVRLRNASLHHAAMNVVIGKRMADYLERQGLPSDRIAIIPNWSDGQAIVPHAPHHNPIRSEWGFEGKFVIGYSGNLGRCHDFMTILQAAEALRDDQELVFLFIGGGHLFPLLNEERRRRALSNIVIQPHQSRVRLSLSLSVPDIHLVSLRPELEGLVVPSKFYGVAAAGRPTIYIGDPSGEIATILRSETCGATVKAGDVDGLVRHIKSLQRNAARRQRWGANARALLLREFDQSRALARWARLIDDIAASPGTYSGPRTGSSYVESRAAGPAATTTSLAVSWPSRSVDSRHVHRATDAVEKN